MKTLKLMTFAKHREKSNFSKIDKQFLLNKCIPIPFYLPNVSILTFNHSLFFNPRKCNIY